MKKKSKGSLLDFMTVCICLLAMAVIVVVYFQLSQLMITRLDMSQVTRKYILRMETKGYLDDGDKAGLIQELARLGVQDIDLAGSTLQPVGYGETVQLSVRGKVVGSVLDTENGWLHGFVQREYIVEEKRMSTAKN